jgi:hypothetical protein
VIGDPATAPPRPDLGFLRRRSRPRPAPVDVAVAAHTPVQGHRDHRVAAGDQRSLTVLAPTVRLTPVQSGIGELVVEAVCSPAVGDLRLGAAYQLVDGHTSTVTGPANSGRPLAVVDADGRLLFDLRQVRRLERLTVYAFSESRRPLNWSGALVATTFGGARVELSLETLLPGRTAVLLSVYRLDAELVLRAEMETIDGDVREAARAYGYDRIVWRDDRYPAS